MKQITEQPKQKTDTHIIVPVYLHTRIKAHAKRTKKHVYTSTKEIIIAGLSALNDKQLNNN